MVSIIRKGWSFKKLINELIRNNIEPTVTLFHWDLPMWAYNMGGWLNRDSIKWFQEYSVKVFEELNDSVKFWTTHNEPFCASILGYYFGIHAPGHKNTREALIAAHHILLSHGAAVEVFREFGFKDSKIGIILNLTPFYPVSDSKEDIEASYRCDGLSNRWFLDPIFKASYPEDMKKVLIKPAGEFDFINPKGRIPRACPWMNVKFARRASSEARKVEKLPRTCPWGFHKRWRFTKNIN